MTERDVRHPDGAVPQPRGVDGGSPGRDGPPALVLAIAVAVHYVLGVVVVATLVGGRVLPGATATARELADLVTDHAVALRVAALFQIVGVVPLALFVAAVAARAARRGAPAASALTLVGGSGAAALMSVDGALLWAVSRLDAASDPGLLRALWGVSSVAGGAAYLACLAVLVLAVAFSGVFAGVLPRRSAVAGLFVAAAALLASSAVLADVPGAVVTTVRLVVLAWLVVAAGPDRPVPPVSREET